jgi:4-hydroxy-tetrahydrodipicolinate synthase
MGGRFGRVVTAMVTPFKEDLSLDVDRAQELARWLADNGSDSLVVAGSTGEAATLTDEEKVTLWRAVAEAVRGKAKVVAGSGTYDTAHSVHLTEGAEGAGVDGILAVTPYYNKPPQRGLIEHFSTIAGATGLPVLLYNIPGRTALRIEHDTLLRLAEVDNIAGVKDATGDFDATSRLIAEAPDSFEVYSGDDWATFGYCCIGAVGAISVASHLAGERMNQMIGAIEQGDIGSGRKIHEQLLPLYKALFVVSNPIPVKAAMALVGQPAGSPRLPLVPASEDELGQVKSALQQAGIL